MSILDEIMQTTEKQQEHAPSCQCSGCNGKNHDPDCQCTQCKQKEMEEEYFLGSWFDWLLPFQSSKPASSPLQPPAQTSKKIQSAVDYNRRKKHAIGWGKHYKKIIRLLGFSHSPDDAAFAKAVMDWQAGKGLTADGKLGTNTWNAMKPHLKLVSSTSTTTSSISTSYKRIYPLPLLWDGRKPRITSKHWHENPSRKPRSSSHPKGKYGGHQGVDIMYPYKPGVDPPKSELKKKKRIDKKGKYWSPENVWVTAFAPGKVRRVGKRANGWRLYIRHPDGLESAYRHLTKPIVKNGQMVKAGDRLARLSPLGSPAHLHFEIRKKRRYGYRQSVNPRPYLENIPMMQSRSRKKKTKDSPVVKPHKATTKKPTWEDLMKLQLRRKPLPSDYYWALESAIDKLIDFVTQSKASSRIKKTILCYLSKLSGTYTDDRYIDFLSICGNWLHRWDAKNKGQLTPRGCLTVIEDKLYKNFQSKWDVDRKGEKLRTLRYLKVDILFTYLFEEDKILRSVRSGTNDYDKYIIDKLINPHKQINSVDKLFRRIKNELHYLPPHYNAIRRWMLDRFDSPNSIYECYKNSSVR